MRRRRRRRHSDTHRRRFVPRGRRLPRHAQSADGCDRPQQRGASRGPAGSREHASSLRDLLRSRADGSPRLRQRKQLCRRSSRPYQRRRLRPNSPQSKRCPRQLPGHRNGDGQLLVAHFKGLTASEVLVTSSTGLRCGMLYLALMLTSAAATAAEIGVSPTSVALDPAHLVRSVQLRNSAAMPLRIEVAIKRWSQRRDGSWDLTDLAGPSDLIVHPLNFDVAPGAAQLVRVGVSRPPAAGPEQAYRLILRELPPESGLHSATGLSILSELTLPVFVSDGSARAEPALESEAIEQGRWRYRLLAGERGHLSPTEASL